MSQKSSDEILECLKRINECNEISHKIDLVNDLILNSDYLVKGNLLTQFAYNQISNKNGLEIFLAYKCNKGKLKELFYNADCDVSLIPIVVYCRLLNIAPNGMNINFQINSNPYKYEILQSELPNFRGDTLTSIQYLLKKHIALLWNKIDNDPNLVKNEKYKLFHSLYKGITNRGFLSSNYGDWDDVLFDHLHIIWDVLDDSLKNFLSVTAWTIGNFIAMPIYVNPSRNNVSGDIDTVDALLWNIYVYYQIKSNGGNLQKHLNKVLSGKYKEEAKNNYTIWLDRFRTWDNFVEINCLQDFVQNRENGNYGCPLSLKSNQIIECEFEDIYKPAPKTYEESINFFSNLNEKCLKRNVRINDKLHNADTKIKLTGFDEISFIVFDEYYSENYAHLYNNIIVKI